MTQLAEDTSLFLSQLGRQGRDVAASTWIESLRKAGLERFRAVGFPTTRMEDWRFTNVAPIARTPFEPASRVPVTASLIAPFTFGADSAVELVFVNGHFEAGLSRLNDVRGLTVMSLAEAQQVDGKRIEQNLGRHASIEANPFVALNSAFLTDGAYVHIARGQAIERPIHLLFISTPSAQPAASHPRTLIIAEQGAQATVVESYAGAGQGVYFTNAVTEIVAEADSLIDHCKLQQENLQAYHVSTTQMDVGRSGNVISQSATLGGRLTRNDLNVTLGGQYAHATLNGLVFIGGDQHCDNHTVLRHEKPDCPSHELYKHVLDGRSMAVFKGKIFVQKDAQKTDSKQTSKSLLLSDEATMESMPALEIYADDVKCTHGSTTGPVDEDMVFYLRTRGISLEAARHLLTYAFAADLTRRIKVEPVRRRLEDHMAAQHGLPQDLRITNLGSHDERAR